MCRINMTLPSLLPVYERHNIDFSHGKGVHLYSKTGKEYLDFFAGYAALAFGHCHPKLVTALTEQAQKLWHISNRYKLTNTSNLAERLIKLSNFAATAFFANSGAEAVECMLKIALYYQNAQGKSHKHRIITAEGGFHGRTLACSVAGGKHKMSGCETPIHFFDQVPFNDIKALTNAITSSTAAILLEPIQGEGGIRPHSKEYLQQVRKLCNQKDILLLFDEVQCGMGRTGHLFAFDYFEVTPDLVSLGKGLGSGIPISACLSSEKAAACMTIGMHGSTYGGNPLAVAVSNAVLDMMLEPKFLEHVREASVYLRHQLEQLAQKYFEVIQKITGAGLMLGIKFKDDVDLDVFEQYCHDEGLLLIKSSNNVMRVTPALIIEKQHCDQGCNKLERAINMLIQLK